MQLISGIYAVFKREVFAIIHDGLYLTSLVILPIIMLLFFVVFFSRGSIDNLPVAVVDNDNSEMSRQLITMVDATRGVAVSKSLTSSIEADDMVLGGEAYGYMVIPEGFENAVLGGDAASVDVAISGANLSAAGVLRSNIQQAVMTLSSGIAISRLKAIGADEYEVMADVMPINTLTHIVANPYLNYGYYLAPIFMFVGVILFTMLSSIYAIGREIRYGTTLNWLAASHDSLFAALLGKLLPTTMVAMVMMWLIITLLSVTMGMELMGSCAVLLFVSLLFIMAYQSIAIAIVALTANMRLALSLGGGYSVMAFTFSGITFPIMAMYGMARALSCVFPFTYFSRVFVSYAMMGADISYSIGDIVMIMLFILITALVWRRLNRVVRDKQYWGRD